jgi:hypothetical protein
VSKSWLFMTVGLFWAFRSLQSFSDPNFYDSHNLNDWVALLTFSLAWWLLAPALLLLPQPHTARWPARLAAAAAVVVGLANVIEDGLQVDAAGIGYGLGTMVFLLSFIAMTVLCLARSPRWSAVVLVSTAVGLLQLDNAGGSWCWPHGGLRSGKSAAHDLSAPCLGLLSVPAALMLAFLTPVLATAFDDDVRSWLRDLDSVHGVADHDWSTLGGSLTHYEFWAVGPLPATSG